MVILVRSISSWAVNLTKSARSSMSFASRIGINLSVFKDLRPGIVSMVLNQSCRDGTSIVNNGDAGRFAVGPGEGAGIFDVRLNYGRLYTGWGVTGGQQARSCINIIPSFAGATGVAANDQRCPTLAFLQLHAWQLPDVLQFWAGWVRQEEHSPVHHH